MCRAELLGRSRYIRFLATKRLRCRVNRCFFEENRKNRFRWLLSEFYEEHETLSSARNRIEADISTLSRCYPLFLFFSGVTKNRAPLRDLPFAEYSEPSARVSLFERVYRVSGASGVQVTLSSVTSLICIKLNYVSYAERFASEFC